MADEQTTKATEPVLATQSLPAGELPSRTRPRKSSIKLDRVEVARRITDDLQRDLDDRLEWNDMRVRRYAKMRGWLETKEFPWKHASNAHVPIMMTDSLRVQDSLYNAVLTSNLPITSQADHKADVDKQDRVDHLLHQQFFREQPGEQVIAEMADTFVNDGVMLTFSPWVKSSQTVADTHYFDPVPEGRTLHEYLEPLIRLMHKQDLLVLKRKGDWAWDLWVRDNEGGYRKIRVDAYIEEEGGPVELVEVGDMVVQNGPVTFVKSIEDYTIPFRAQNPQAPGPENPGGASHVVLWDYPTLDEIKRLKAEGFYDLMTDEDITALEAQQTPVSLAGDTNQLQKEIKDDLEGTTPTAYAANGQPTLTRLTCFYGMDIDGDGLDEQVVIRMIRETKTVLRARLLTEETPAYPPRRPLMAKAFIPVKDRFYGISLLELLEPLYDQMKIVLDQMVDAGTIRIMPWGLIRASSGIRNEPIRIAPGMFYPSANPSQDLFVPQFSNGGDALFQNLLTLYSQWADQETMIGSLNFGQVPAGRSAALRTTGNMQSVLQQGDARPEHLLRRFFSGLAEIYAQYHELNQAFLPREKEIRMVGVAKEGEEPYSRIPGRDAIKGRFQFEFKATVLNTSRALLSNALGSIMGILINPVTMQTGIAKPEGIYRAINDYLRSQGVEPTRYLSAPSPQATGPRLDARDALTKIVNGEEPQGYPLEPGGAAEHLKALQDLLGMPEFAMLQVDAMGQLLLNRWRRRMMGLAQQEAQQQQMIQAAGQFQQSMMGGGQQGPGAPPQGNTPPPQAGPAGNPMVSPNEAMV